MDEEVKVHLALKQKLSNGIDIDSSEYENLCKQVEAIIGRGLAKRKKTPFEKFDALETNGSLKPGSYDLLREIFQDSANAGFLEDIDEANVKIRDIRKRRGDTAGYPVQASGSLSAFNPSPPTKRVRNASPPQPPSPDSDSCYPSTKSQKGLLVIVNFRDNREGTDEDVAALKAFFGTTLGFEVVDGRSGIAHDFTTDELNTYLQKIRHKLNADTAKQYYCFILVTLSHGDKNGIVTRNNGRKKIEDIRKEFNSENVETFKGRPKLIFVQKCRGKGLHPGVQLDDASPTIDDASDESHNVPVDADTLIGFSNTPGYVSFRYESFGTQFIRQIVSVFRADHHHSHVEEMLIKVRYNVADRTVIYEDNECKEMPCVWTTLRKKLMLR